MILPIAYKGRHIVKNVLNKYCVPFVENDEINRHKSIKINYKCCQCYEGYIFIYSVFWYLASNVWSKGVIATSVINFRVQNLSRPV
jgi:hypothetical protein